MQSIVRGPGTGGRMRTLDTGTSMPCAAASSRGLWLSQRSIRPFIKLPGPACGMSLTAALTSTTTSFFSTPSLKSSKKSNFIVCPSQGVRSNTLFDPGDPGLGDDVPVFHNLVRQECRGLVELEPDRRGTDFFESHAHGRIFQGFVQRGVQPFQD